MLIVVICSFEAYFIRIEGINNIYAKINIEIIQSDQAHSK